MNDIDHELVEAIAKEVVGLLHQRGQSAGNRGPMRAQISPPIGTCTGDYSKFPELAGRIIGTNLHATTPLSPPLSTPPEVMLSGIVTAKQLQEAMDKAPGGIATITTDARLTPLANDLLRQYPNRVCRSSANTPIVGPFGGQPWLWWMDGQCSAAEQEVSVHGERLRPLQAPHVPSAIGQVIRNLALSLKAGQITGGVLFVRRAAVAMCFANRCESIRAVLGTCEEAVRQGVSELGANVLVIEYPHQNQIAMAAMINQIMKVGGSGPKVPIAVERELSNLSQCGRANLAGAAPVS